MADDRRYISKVVLPGETIPYYIKDERVDSLGNATKFLGITSDSTISDGSTVADVELTDGTTIDIDDITDGCIIIQKGSLDLGAEYICATVSSTKKWFLFGDISVKDIGELAQYDTISLSGTVGSSTKDLSATARPVAFSTTAVTGATKIITISSTTGSVNVPTEITYTKPTGSGTVTVNSSATFTGQYSIPSTLKQGTITKNTAGNNFTLSAATGGQKIITDVPNPVINQSVGVTIGSTNVYGLASATTKYMTGSETLSKVSTSVINTIRASTVATNNVVLASVSNEILTLYALSFGTQSVLSNTTTLTAGTSATATTFSVGASGAVPSANITQPTFTIAATSNTYKVYAAANTYVTGVDDPSIDSWDSSDVTVTGSAVTASAVTVGTTTSNASITSSTAATVINGTSTFYGTVSAYAGGDTVVSGVNNGTLSLSLSKNSQ